MARLLLPQPPRSRGLVGLITGLVLVGWTAYLLLSYQGPSLLSPIQPSLPDDGRAQYVEIDLRGPQYDAGRYAGYVAARQAAEKGFTAPAEKVLEFQASEAAGGMSLEPGQAEDYRAGYLSGYGQGLKGEAKGGGLQKR